MQCSTTACGSFSHVSEPPLLPTLTPPVAAPACLQVNGAKVVAADIMVGNGVIHVIDTVMLPPVKPAAYARSMAGVTAPFGYFDPLGAHACTHTPTHRRTHVSWTGL